MAYGESKEKLGDRGKLGSAKGGFNKESGTQKSTFQSGCGNCWQGKEWKNTDKDTDDSDD